MGVLARFAKRARRGWDDRENVARELQRIQSAPRYEPLSTTLLGANFEIVDGLTFAALYREIFMHGIYAFTTDSRTPRIIDGGANTGVSVLFFKRAHPGSRIIAFEADPRLFATLGANVRAAGYTDVELIGKALWTDDQGILFWAEGSVGGRAARPTDDASGKIHVPTVRLRDYLDERTDLLKLDIEGAETNVLLDCKDHLHNVDRVFVEYHSFADAEQTLDKLLNLLRTSGFRVYVQTEVCPSQPFVDRTPYMGMDLQLNIFAIRERADTGDRQ